MDENIFYPELTLETDDIIMELDIKKDYSKIINFRSFMKVMV